MMETGSILAPKAPRRQRTKCARPTQGNERPFRRARLSRKGKICNYAGGKIPFAETRAERLASGDPRPSLEERYGIHEG
jgi:hypothetical protein